jgi:exosortase/archaeosortase family protein
VKITGPAGRIVALLGLAALGEGLFILMRVVPHESVWLGAALALGGGIAVAIAPLPRIERLPGWPLAVGGALVVVGLLAYDAVRRAPLDPPKVAILVFGAALVAASPFVHRRSVASSVAWSLPLVGAPLAVWASQALTKATVAGMTPMELFIRYALLAPMAGALTLLGRHPSINGQVITYATPRGPFALEVGVACSGLQAMGLFMGILLVFVLAEKPGWRRGLLWSAIGLGGVYVVNVIRLITLALVGSRWGGDALEWTHANAGWAFFVAWSAMFAWLSMGRAKKAMPG